MIGIEHYVVVSSILFVLGVLGIFLNRKNVIIILMAIELGTPDGSAAPAMRASNTEAIGALLYSRYLFLFEAAGIVLLVAMVGAIVLTHRERKDQRPQTVSRQIDRRPEEATVNTRPEVGQGVVL